MEPLHQTHEIAAAFIIGGFIILNKPKTSFGDRFAGGAIITLALLACIGINIF